MDFKVVKSFMYKKKILETERETEEKIPSMELIFLYKFKKGVSQFKICCLMC